jgi:hypothetical protein
MKKTVLTFGLISGVLIAGMMLGTIPFADRIGFDKGAYVGYTTMVLAFLLVFFGIRSYRENVGDGTISFGRGFAVGILITLVTCAFYVFTWEVMYFKLMPDFANKYGSYMIEKLRSSGASQPAIDAKLQEVKQLKQILDNPLLSSAAAFAEIFPIGLIITGISAAILRKKSSVMAEGGSARTTLSEA